MRDMTILRSFAIYFSTVFWAVLYWGIVLVPLLLSLFLPVRIRQKFVRILLLWFGLLTIHGAWRPFFRVSFKDLSGSPLTPGVVAVNHRAATDAFLVAMLHSSCAQTVNGWPMRTPIIGTVAYLAGYLNITNWSFEKLRSRAETIIKSGDVIVSFPEGTRSESKEMNPFHSGIFQLALELNLPVHILCIAGNEFMPDRKFRFRCFRKVLTRRIVSLSAEEVQNCGTAFALKKTVFRMMKEELARMDEELENENRI